MIKLSRHKIDLEWYVREYNTNGTIRIEKVFPKDQRKEAVKYAKQLIRNLYNRERNAILKDLCGTSARSARLDMGI